MPKRKKKKKNKETNKPLPKVTVSISKLMDEYHESDQLLKNRITDKRFGFDTYDKLFQSYIDPAKWPYSVKLATPRGFTGVFNKTTRMIGGKFSGRIEANTALDEVGAKVGTQHFRWSVNRFNQRSDFPVESILALWDSNTRLYGGGFLRLYWKIEYKNKKNPKTGKTEKVKVYDNPWVEVINNRDLLLQPGRESIQSSDYVIHRRYVSLEQLERIQEDGAKFDEESMKKVREAKEGLGKDDNYTSILKTIKGQSFDDVRFELCTTYYKDKWVTWMPYQGSDQKEGLILRQIENPYLHGDIPIVPLVYIPSQEDIYGMSELQPVSALLKILSALQSQFVELVNKNLYPPTLVNVNESRIDTFKFRPKAFWLVNDPGSVQVLDTKAGQSLASFSETYKMIVTEFLEAMGETGAGVSSVDLLGGDKTATEVKDKAFLRGSRDNFNKLMLSSSLKRLMYLWFEMIRDPKFTDKNTVIKIVGKDALEYFDKQGFTDWKINDAGYQLVVEYAQQLEMDEDLKMGAEATGTSLFDLAYDILTEEGVLDQFAEPISPVMTAEGEVEKLITTESDENTGYMYVDPENDYLGNYSFVADVEALSVPDPEKEYAARSQWYKQATEAESAGLLQREGYQLKHKDILAKMAENLKIKDADQYFEKAQGVENEIVQGGTENQGVGDVGQGVPAVGSVPQPTATPQQPVGEGIPQAQ